MVAQKLKSLTKVSQQVRNLTEAEYHQSSVCEHGTNHDSWMLRFLWGYILLPPFTRKISFAGLMDQVCVYEST